MGLLPALVPLPEVEQQACLLATERAWALAASGFLPPARCVCGPTPSSIAELGMCRHHVIACGLHRVYQ